MRKIPIGEAQPQDGGQLLRYAIVIDEVSTPCGPGDDDSDLEIYGIEVSAGNDTALVRGVTPNATYILNIAKTLRKACVTPIHTREILEDLLVT